MYILRIKPYMRPKSQIFCYIFGFSFRDNVIAVTVDEILHVFVIYVFYFAFMCRITECDHSMERLIFRESEKLRQLCLVTGAYNTTSDALILRRKRHI